MRKLFSIITILFALSASGQEQELFRDIFKYTWAQESYINDLIKTKSPYKSQNKLSDIVEIDFDRSEIKGDSIFVGAPSIHEGTSFYAYFRPGLKANSLPTNINGSTENFYELGYEVNNQDTSLYLYRYNKDKKIISKEKYIKVRSNYKSALEFMVNKTLFSGKYEYIDSTGIARKVTFTDDGKIVGFYNYSKYYISTDFIAGPENNLDEIILNLYSNDQKEYAYIIKGDTIYFYDAIENKYTLELKLGKLRYKFVHVKVK